MKFAPKKTLLTVVLATLSLQASADAGLKQALQDVLEGNPRMVAAGQDIEAAQQATVEQVRRSWTPQLDLNWSAGRQYYKDGALPSSTDSIDRASVKLTQRLLDFGRSDNLIDEKRSFEDQQSAVKASAEGGLLLEALTAYLNVIRAKETLDYAKASEEQIKTLAKVESSKVEMGKGYASDVMQAKVQLAAAESKRLRAEGNLEIANARVKAVFESAADGLEYSGTVAVTGSGIPSSLNEALKLAGNNNKQLQVGMHRSEVIRSRINRIERTEYLPELKLIGEYATKEGFDGDPDRKNDGRIMLELSYRFNLGGAGGFAVQGATHELNSSMAREDVTRLQVEEQVAIAWRNLEIAKLNGDILTNQLAVASNYLDSVVAERANGRRGVNDVVSAEVQLNSVKSDLAASRADTAIAEFTLLQAMGTLSLDVLTF